MIENYKICSDLKTQNGHTIAEFASHDVSIISIKNVNTDQTNGVLASLYDIESNDLSPLIQKKRLSIATDAKMYSEMLSKYERKGRLKVSYFELKNILRYRVSSISIYLTPLYLKIDAFSGGNVSSYKFW